MAIDRAHFTRLVSETVVFREKEQDPFQLFCGQAQGKRKVQDDLIAIAYKIFDSIENKQKVGRCEVKLKFQVSEETQDELISSFLKENYCIVCEIQRTSSESHPLKRARPDDSDEIFSKFFGRNIPVGASIVEKVESLWQINWADNPSLLKNPLPKPKMAEPGLPATVTDADRKLNQQRQANELCDVTFCIGDNHFPVHRIILANRSPYFNRMLQSGMKESKAHEVFDIKETSARNFSLFLNAIYTQRPPQEELTFEKIVELTNYAMLTEVEFLFRWGKIQLVNRMSLDTFYHIAILAFKLDDQSLIDYCKYYISQHEKALLEFAVDLSELSLVEVIDLYEVGLKLKLQSIANGCIADIKEEIANDKESFVTVCSAAMHTKDSVADTLKKICFEYVKTHKQDFAKPEMKEAKELYIRLMTGLE